jgi:hypothetical protein
MKTAAMKAAAMKLGFGRGGRRGDRHRHSERRNGRDHGFLDRTAHGKHPPADRRALRPASNLKTMLRRKKV